MHRTPQHRPERRFEAAHIEEVEALKIIRETILSEDEKAELGLLLRHKMEEEKRTSKCNVTEGIGGRKRKERQAY